MLVPTTKLFADGLVAGITARIDSKSTTLPKTTDNVQKTRSGHHIKEKVGAGPSVCLLASTGHPAALVTMKIFLVFSTIVAAALAKPSGFFAAPLAYATVPVAAPVSSQYHAQDELGQYSYGYASGLSAKAETKTFDGITRGSYSYVDAEGKLQSVEYVSDALNGFRAAASNLPVAPAVPAVPALAAPVPVVDTPEVAEAKAKHLAAIQEIASRASAAPAEEASSSEAPATEAASPEPSPPPTSPAPEANATTEAAPAVAPVVPAAAAIVATPYTFAVPAVSAVSSFAAPAVTTYRFGPAVLPAIATYSAPWTIAAPAPAATVEAKGAPEVTTEQPKQN